MTDEDSDHVKFSKNSEKCYSHWYHKRKFSNINVTLNDTLTIRTNGNKSGKILFKGLSDIHWKTDKVLQNLTLHHGNYFNYFFGKLTAKYKYIMVIPGSHEP